MSSKDFKKEEFVRNNEGQYQLEFKTLEIGQGSNLTVERKNETGEYETIQAEIKRNNDSIFINWSEPFDGRIIFEN
ncbi:glutathione synthase [Chryseobacterium sp. FH2]|uniref:hypothetical protein n=1 Tax=Chryseobacterium sp. FH2 TaxID=1674291 RepID=UPI00065AAF64|nr:hypothetical protein [Chryseobacterium sp. FH2]KMQ68545.1 glutathione synthase [Chryseobacterium sp. FH2]